MADCWQCGGEGRVNHCWDDCCADPDDIYCGICSRTCEICKGAGGWGGEDEDDYG